MLGLEKDTILKLQIIKILVNYDRFVSIDELQESIGTISKNKIMNACTELKEIIDHLYQENNYSLKVAIKRGSGIRIIKHSTNFQTLYKYLYSNDLTHTIVRNLLIKREINSMKFSLDIGVSNSTLRRKIQQINKELKNYNIHISFSRKLRLKGEEFDIRVFSYIYFRGLYRQFSDIEWIQEIPAYNISIKKIYDYLHIPNSISNIECLSIWYFVITKAIETKRNISSNSFKSINPKDFDLIERPKFLKAWPLYEWKFLLIAVYCSQISNFDLKLLNKELDESISNYTNQWLSIFKKSFSSLNTPDISNFKKDFKQQYFSRIFFKLDYFTVQAITDLIHIDSLKESYENYFKKFEKSWNDFLFLNPLFDNNQSKIYSQLNCLELFPIEFNLPQIIIHLVSELSDFFEKTISISIRLYLGQRYKIIFTPDIHEAQLILGTTVAVKRFAQSNQSVLVINSQIFSRDIVDIETSIKEVLREENII